ncbi:hypothetical protein N7478_008331 [Penicillium angulare]|uniref:uncharacterized protein n=1 Tax=Penicillium angulare TaxID=116970 RepID=UPI002542526C|nr:uncharacterized protein N7478_008331 [Penicillium angulare]KAJ5273206.1 hypothetical protein N7478_008331 [Penicillium angulare]
MAKPSITETTPDWNKVFNDEKFIKQYELGEKVTGVFGQALVDQTDVVAHSKSHQEHPLVALDNACGTGVVSSILQNSLDDEVKAKMQLTCADFSQGMLEYTRRRIEREGWVNADVKHVDAQDTKLPSDHYSHVFTSFAYMALPKGLSALDETTRILQPGGIIAFTTWIEPGWVPVTTEAIATLPYDLPWPSAKEFLSFLNSGEWDNVEWIESELKKREFGHISVNAVTKHNTMPVAGFVDMTMFMVPVIIEHFWSEKMRQAHKEKIRPTLEKYLVETYGADGEVPGEWKAIVSTARKAVA